MIKKQKKRKLWKILAALVLAAAVVWFCIPFSVGVLNIGNFLGLALCVFLTLWLLGYPAARRQAEQKGKLPLFRRLNRALAAVLCVGGVWAAVLTGLMIFGMYSVPPEHATVVVLGSQVKGTVPSLDLWARIRRASEYLQSNPQAVCIASGGQGSGEDISEAKCIRDTLISLGIDGDRILLEDTSTNTKENLGNSKKIIEAHGLSKDLAIVTDEFHEYRAGRIAARTGMTPYAVSAQSPWYIFSANYVRELLAITKDMIFP